jgi:hypothetical protein
MKKSITVIVAILAFALVAGAQEAPRAEAFMGYDFVRFNPNSAFVPSFNANGGSGQFIYNFNNWIGGVVDVGAVTKGVIGGLSGDATALNFLAGPRVSFRHHSRLTPFAEVMFGGAYTTASTEISVLPLVTGRGAGAIVLDPTLPISARIVASREGFAMMAGGGVDMKVNKWFSFRPIGVDYYLMRLPSSLTGDKNNLNNFRYSAGAIFTFGAQ